MSREPPPTLSRTAALTHGFALVLLLTSAVWGATIYSDLPELIPTHWNAAGQADAFSQKSVFSAFGALFAGALLVFLMLTVNVLLGRSRYLVPAERRANELTLGYVNVSMAVLFAWVSVAGWLGLPLGPSFIVVVLLAGLPVLLIIGLHLPTIIKERKALSDPADPSLDPKFWVLGGVFYNNPNDTRSFVPKPPHTGTGLTMNLASTGGRLALALVLAVLVGSLVLVLML